MDLPISIVNGREYNSILMVVDRYTNMVKYMFCCKSIDTLELATLLFNNIFKLYGFPTDITSDHGSMFTSNFWLQLCFHLQIKWNLSMAYHLQTDGQTEVQNRTLEMYLWLYCNYRQDNWADWLLYAEFAYNNSVQSSMGETPFMVLMGFHPWWVNEIENDPVPEEAPVASQQAKMLQAIHLHLTEQYEKSVEHMVKYYNCKWKIQSFALGDKVLLSTHNLCMMPPSKKLENHWYSPFKVLETVGTHTYQLDLPTGWKMHPIYHITQLEPFQGRKGKEPEQPPPVTIDNHEEWEVEEILDKQTHYQKKQYLVKWKGFKIEDSTWQSEQDLENVKDCLKAYKCSQKVASEEAKHWSGRKPHK